MRNFSLLVAVSVLILHSETLAAASNHCENSFASEFYFKWENNSKESEEFGKQNLNNQWEILQYAMECIHPRRLEYYKFMAQGGAEAAQFLGQKLGATNDEFDIIDIISVLDQMSRLRTYDIAGDEQLMATVLDAADRVETDIWKNLVQRKINQIVSRQDAR
jgi:hypothetical protein